jgi:adenylate cyclase class IV
MQLSYNDNIILIQVVLEEEQSVEEGQKIADELMERLGINSIDLIVGAYMDLIRNQNKTMKTE